MAIAASGAVSFSDLRTEYSVTGAVSFSDFYRGAASGFVRALAANNTATNLSSGVPASGTINFTNFRSQARGFRFTFTSGATNQSGSGLFGTDWGVDYPKDIVINSGVTLGGTSASEEALEISTGGLGTITITNNGTLIGAGGAANGGAGGDAFEAFVTCSLINNGSIFAGGGGGGQGGTGGTGGGGSYTQTTYSACQGWATNSSQSGCNQAGNNAGHINCTHTFYSMMDDVYWICSAQLRSTSTVNTNGGAGGAGGNGGVGAGYNQNVSNGSGGAGGANGGTNAGTGGTGGTGGNGGGYGTNGSAGSAGANGANGNRTGGAGGAAAGSAGSAGAAIRGTSFATVTNNGTITGGQV